MRNRFVPLTGLIGGMLLALSVAGMVAAYSGQVAATIEVSFPSGAQPCDTPITVTARVLTIDGATIDAQDVRWSLTGEVVTGDSILPATTTTNAGGIATSQVTFACTPHDLTIVAKAGDATGTVAITVTGTGTGQGLPGTGQGLPRTDTAPASSFPTMALSGLAVLIGSLVFLRKFAADRR